MVAGRGGVGDGVGGPLIAPPPHLPLDVVLHVLML